MDKLGKLRADLEKKLHEPGLVNDALGRLEARSGVPRVYAVLGGLRCAVSGLLPCQRVRLCAALALLAGLYLVFGFFAELACNLVGFAYPCYRS